MFLKLLLFSSLIYFSSCCFSNSVFGDSLSNIILPKIYINGSNCNVFINQTIIFQIPLSSIQNASFTVTNTTDCCQKCLGFNGHCNYYEYQVSSNNCSLYSNTANQIKGFNSTVNTYSGFYY